MNALALGCEPETGSDAAVSDAAVVQAEAGAAVPDAGATGALDAAPTPTSDASTPSQDATLPPSSDASTPASGDAALPSGDAASPVGSDASASDSGAADSAGMDGAEADAGAHDSGAALDGPAPVDVAGADTGTRTDASTTDAAQTEHERSGEVLWDVKEGPGTAFCPHPSIALWKDETRTLHDPTSPGFECYLNCRVPADPETSEATFLLATHEFGLFLFFRGRVMLGYSTESFRENLLRAQLHWTAHTRTSIGEGQLQVGSVGTAEAPTVEIVSYQAPLLHVRVRGRSVWQTDGFDEQATVPYFCVTQAPGVGSVPHFCTHVNCSYATESLENGVSLTLDLQLPIQQPAP